MIESAHLQHSNSDACCCFERALDCYLAKGFALDIPAAPGRGARAERSDTLPMSRRQGPSMNSFYEHHKDSIRFHYRCFDRILLNGLIQPFQQPERVVGFFDAYRQLYPVSRDTLRGIADRFQQWLASWVQRRDIPVLDAPKGRRDEFVEPYFKGAKPDEV